MLHYFIKTLVMQAINYVMFELVEAYPQKADLITLFCKVDVDLLGCF